MFNLNLQLLVTFQVLIWIANCDNFSSTSNNMREIISLVNNVAQLPCPVGSLDDVAMVLWFKTPSGTPIYSYDARLEKEPKHVPVQNAWGLRLYFRLWPNERKFPALIIRDVKLSDEGIYRCRVDYRSEPTSNYLMRLKVILPPSHMEIIDVSEVQPISDQNTTTSQKDYQEITYLGPYREFQNVTIRCNVYGGKPLPEVKWFKNSVEIDGTYESVGTNYVVNELRITNLRSEHSTEFYTCKASNSNESKPLQQIVNLDVYLGVKEIDLEIPNEMTAGVEYNLICKATGAYPTVKMEIWKSQKRMGSIFEAKSDSNNATEYHFQYKPEMLDDEESLICKAYNPGLKQPSLSVSKPLKITYTPVAILRFGQNKTRNFTEGETVLMECHVKANPAVFSIAWFHGAAKLEHNEAHGVRITGTTLVLTNLRATSSGKYFCKGANVIGKEMSNPLEIQLNLAPRCVSSTVIPVPLDVGESQRLECSILAWPPDLNFYWTLNRSNDVVPILPMAVGNYTEDGIGSIPLEEFDPYISPIMRPALPHRKDLDGFSPDNLTRPSSGLNDRELSMSLMDTKGSEGGSAVPSWKARYLRIRRKSDKKELKPLDKKDGLKGSDGLIHSRGAKPGHVVESLYGRWKAPEDTSDNIHHQAFLSYTIKSIEDYGLVACWAKNSIGKQLSPCIFHIISSKEANQDEAMGGKEKEPDLTPGSSQTGPLMLDRPKEKGVLVPSKLPMTILIALLIFIACLGLSAFSLLMFAKRRQMPRLIRPRQPKKTAQQAQPPPEHLEQQGGLSGQGSITEDCGTSVLDLDPKKGDETSSSCFDLSSDAGTTFTLISHQNEFPPPPTSIISTTSASHGYGSIEEDEDDDAAWS